NLPAPIKILQISDLHDKQFGGSNSFLKEKVKKLAPDLIVLTGDTVSTGGEKLLSTAKFLRELCKIAPVVGILGNHEQRRDVTEFITAAFKAAGVIVLNNELVTLNINGTDVNILGLCEHQAIKRIDYAKSLFGFLNYENHDDQLRELSECRGLRILLSHFPENYAKSGNTRYNRFDFTLQMSGHAHGGQVRLPFVGGVYAPGQGLFPKYDKGLYKGSHNNLLVSAGLGNDSPFPRINNRPTIDMVTFF
ncbi:MAG: metallophosphoesterase, partial [Oscillospiraceae bacterium]